MFGKIQLNTLKFFGVKMMYKGCSNLVFQPAKTLVAIAAFNKEVLVLKPSSFTRNLKKREERTVFGKMLLTK